MFFVVRVILQKIKTMDNKNLGHVKTELNAHIATITFFHPAHNSLPSRLLAELTEAITRAGNDEAVRVVVLQSEGHEKTFCAGASFDELADIQSFEQGLAFFSGFANVINAIRKCPKLVVGRVQGRAIGGGVGLAAAVDYCMASAHASVKLSELAVGIGPFVVGPAVERKMGLSAFSELAINASEWRTAAWARERGLFHECFETIEQLDAYMQHFCQKLATQSPEAMRELKQIFWQNTAHWDTFLAERAAISGRLVLSDFTKKAISAFKNKA